MPIDTDVFVPEKVYSSAFLFVCVLTRFRNFWAAATMVDYSMLSSSEAAKERESQSKEAGGDSRFGANAFDDLTDLQNNEFIVSGIDTVVLTCLAHQIE